MNEVKYFWVKLFNSLDTVSSTVEFTPTFLNKIVMSNNQRMKYQLFLINELWEKSNLKGTTFFNDRKKISSNKIKLVLH